MRITNTETGIIVQYDDIYELNYQLLNTIGLYTDAEGYVYDQDTKNQINMLGKRLKVSTSPQMIQYPGNGEIMLDPLHNLQQMTMLLGYHIDKKVAQGEMTFLSQFIEDTGNKEDPRTALTVKFDSVFSITGSFYLNRCLKFVQMIFLIDNIAADLSNFDNEEELRKIV